MKVYRNSVEIIDVTVDNKTVLKKTLLGEDLVQANFILDSFFTFQIGDYIEWRNKRYTILKQPSVSKLQTNKFQYNFDLESDQYKMLNALYLFDGQPDFFLLGDVEKFANLAIVNLNRIAGEGFYQLGEFPETSVKNLNFQNTNCLAVIQRLAKEFDIEYYFSEDGKTINYVEKVGNDSGLEFKFKRGLRNIERQKINENNIVTRLFAFGGERNIGNDYGSKRLKIDAIENNTNLFGIIEGVVTYEDIYPHRESTVTAIEADDITKFADSTLDFNINDYLIEGVVAKVTFNTGYLAGYEFELTNYNNDTNTFTLIQYQDSNGLIFPNEDLKIQEGDKFVIHEITMPEIYIQNAEEELLQKAEEYLEKNSLPNVIYNIVPDYPYLRKNFIQLDIGDIITVIDNDFNITFETRILSLTQSISNPYLYSIKVGEKATIGYITRVLDNIDNVNNTVTVNEINNEIRYNRIRRNLINIDELRDSIFDPDGYFDMDNIRPLSIETSMLTVGTKGQQFIIQNLLIEANFKGDPNKVRCGKGTLVHFTINPDEIEEWNITGITVTLADENTPYYVYAKCSKTTNTGAFTITTEQFNTNESDAYYFLIGVMHSVIDNVRGVSLTYGQTTINGRFITTGRVQSIDGFNFFDLDQGKFNLGTNDSGLDWNVTKANKLTLRGALIQTQGGGQPIENSFEVEYSINGIDNWHNPFEVGDEYMRQRSWSGPWSAPIRIVGEDGATGNYFDYIFRRAASQPSKPTVANPADWFDSPPSGDTHLWMSKAEKDSDNKLIGTWSEPVRLTGEDGADGESGPSVVYRGIFNQNNIYYNNDNRRDAVKYNGVYYIYRGKNGVALAWSSSNWENFGAQFESVATNLLLAENANIADWMIRNGKITSQNTFNGKPKAELDGVNGVITLKSPITKRTSSGNRIYEQNIKIDAVNSRISATHSGDSFHEDGEVYIDSEGVVIKTTGLYTGTSFLNSGRLYAGAYTVVKNKHNIAGSLVGVYGKAERTSGSPGRLYGGLFYGLKSFGRHVGIKLLGATTKTYYTEYNDEFISCYSTSWCNIYLPTQARGKYSGRKIYVKPINHNIVVHGNGEKIIRFGSVSNIELPRGEMWYFIFDGSYWLSGRMYS